MAEIKDAEIKKDSYKGLTLDLRRYLVLFGMAIKAKSTPNKSFLNY